MVVAVFLLTRFERTLRQLEQSVNLLTIVVAKMSGQDFHKVKREFFGNKGDVE